MSTFAFGIVVSVTVALTASAQAAPAFNIENCPERTSADNWCPSLLAKEGWTLKYQSKSSPQLMDVYWTHEIWIRERAALVCSHVGGRGGIRINECRALDEVDR
jgi:hypothetical protein